MVLKVKIGQRCAIAAIGTIFLSAIVPTTLSALATGIGSGGCAGAGGGDTTGIGAILGCGLPPPAAPTAQNSGDGVSGPATGPALGTQCIPTNRLPSNRANPTAPSRDYLVISPAVSGSPETGLTASGTLYSALPIGSPKGPHTVAVPPQTVKTAAQQNADGSSEAQGIADEFNSYQAQQFSGADSAGAFDHGSTALAQLLNSAQYSASNFYVPLGPPLPGGTAVAEDATTWSFLESVYVDVGTIVHDQLSVGPLGLPIYGPLYCSHLSVVGTDPAYLDTQVTTTVPSFTAQINHIADALWHSFRRGTIVSMPAAGSPAYVGVPTCVGVDTGLPTGSGTPNPFTISLPLTLNGLAGKLPVTVSGRVAVSIVADGAHWNFNDPSGDTSVHGQDSTDPTPPRGAPTYDASTRTWPDADSQCSVHHEYRALAASPGVLITATEHFHIEVSGVYSTGAATPVTFAQTYEPADSPVTWTTGPFPIYQIEAVPYQPTS